MKSYKKILPVFLVFAFFASVYYSVNGKIETATAYQETVTQARDYAEKELISDAIESYTTAISLKPSLELCLEAGQLYIDNEDYSNAKKWFSNQLLENYPAAAETYLYGIKLYLSQDNYRMAYSVYDQYQKRELYLEAVENEMDSVRYKYTLIGSFTDGGVFSNAAGVAAAKYEDSWGYVDIDVDRALPYIYESASPFTVYAAIVDDEGKAAYIDTSGNVRINENSILANDPEFGHVVKFQNIQSNMVLAYNGSIWNYYSIDDCTKLFGGYKEALPVANGIGAVSEDGQHWLLIDANGEAVTDSIYDWVLSDEKSIVCWGDTLVVQQNGEYFLIDKTGQKLNSNAYSDARAFNDDTSYAAVLKGKSWIFVDTEGHEYQFGDYEEAQSFSNGLAAVKQDDLWGYINTEGEIVIPCSFLDAKPFNRTGLAFVETREDYWQVLSLYSLNHE